MRRLAAIRISASGWRVLRDGREAVTEFHVKETYGENSLLELLPKTGRTHQIRVHLAFIGHPVVGDTVYGYRKQQDQDQPPFSARSVGVV